MASAEPYANLHIAPDKWPHQHPTTQFFQAGCPSCRPTNSVKALKEASDNLVINGIISCKSADVPWSVCVLVTTVNFTKMTELIKLPFLVWPYMDPGNQTRNRFTKILRLSYDNAEVTIDLPQSSNLQNILRRAQGFYWVHFACEIVKLSEIIFVNWPKIFLRETPHTPV